MSYPPPSMPPPGPGRRVLPTEQQPVRRVPPPEPNLVSGLPPQRPPAQRPGPGPQSAPKRRPFAISLSIGMTIVASIEWIFALLISWLFIVTGLGALGVEELGDAAIYRILSSAHHSLTEGLIIPLLVFPMAAILLACLLLQRKPLMRLMYTALGVVTVGWAIWWLRGDWWWWAIVLAHIGIALALVWVPSSSAWYDEGADEVSAPVVG